VSVDLSASHHPQALEYDLHIIVSKAKAQRGSFRASTLWATSSLEIQYGLISVEKEGPVEPDSYPWLPLEG